MECQDCTDSLTAHIDGELDPDLTISVELHLESCEGCRQDYRSLLECSDLMERVPWIQPDPLLWSSISANILPLHLPESPWKRFLLPLTSHPWIPVGAGTLGVAVVSLLLLQPSGSGTREALSEYIQVRERIEMRHETSIQNVGFQNSTNPFRAESIRPRSNPFSKEP